MGVASAGSGQQVGASPVGVRVGTRTPQRLGGACGGVVVEGRLDHALAPGQPGELLGQRVQGPRGDQRLQLDQVAGLAFREQLLITEIRPAGGGLEEMFLQLTADDARDTITKGQAA